MRREMRPWPPSARRPSFATQLREQLNVILETRETARGLIVNLSDVLFDFDKATLRPGAREKLAKVAGIVLAHPGLKTQAEGHADAIGTDSTISGCPNGVRSQSARSWWQQGISTEAVAAADSEKAGQWPPTERQKGDSRIGVSNWSYPANRLGRPGVSLEPPERPDSTDSTRLATNVTWGQTWGQTEGRTVGLTLGLTLSLTPKSQSSQGTNPSGRSSTATAVPSVAVFAVGGTFHVR